MISMKKIGMIMFLVLAIGNMPIYAQTVPDIVALKTAYEQAPRNILAGRNYAVALARGNQLAESLTVFDHLINLEAQNAGLINDYLVVLNWAEKHADAVRNYEMAKTGYKGNWPDYVQLAVAGSYYKSGNYKAAYQLYHRVAANGNINAKKWEAESLMRGGQTDKANAIYDSLLTTGQDKDIMQVYLSRASIYMLNRDYSSALADYTRAKKMWETIGDKDNLGRRIDYDMAVLYIRSQEPEPAVRMLKPYMKDNTTADIHMQGDYILALRLNGDYQNAISEAKRLWPDHSKVPEFALQALAEAYHRSGQYKNAVTIYKEALIKNPKNNLLKLQQAVCEVLSDNNKEAFVFYNDLLVNDPPLAQRILNDAEFLMGVNRLNSGTAIYSLVVTKYPNNAEYRQQFADSLFNHDMPRDAYIQYSVLAKLPSGQLAGQAGMAKSAALVRDYAELKKITAKLEQNPTANPVSATGIKAYERRVRGQTSLSYSQYFDFKKNDSSSYELNSAVNVGGSDTVLVNISRNKLKDKDANPIETNTLTARSLGLQRVDMKAKYDFQVWIDTFLDIGSFNGYRFLGHYYISDNTYFTAGYASRPLLDVQALNLGDARIMDKSYTLGITRRVGLANIYSLMVTKGKLSDNNEYYSAELRWDKNIISDRKGPVNMDWFVSASRSSFKNQTINGEVTPYESPSLRETYSTGWVSRWSKPKYYWELTTAIEYGRDNDEPFDFSPNTRLEYGYNFTPSQYIRIGAEYGARTNRLNNSSSLGFGYRQYDIMYYLQW